ncbi:MAG: VWA domain-containing protein [Phycisphaerae bacterium]|nr:VWA domain-containing protein [Phycisphaerae bacterium]
MKAILCVGTTLVAAVVLCLVIPGCLGTDSGAYLGLADGSSETGVDRGAESGGSDAASSPDGSDAAAGESPAETDSSDEIGDTSDGDETAGDDDDADGDGAQSGTLTAGSFDDNLNLETFTGFLDEVLDSDETDVFPDVQLGQRVIVTVVDESGNPVNDARVIVTLESEQQQQQQQQQPALNQTTGSDGRVLFLTGLDGGDDATSFQLQVQSPVEGTESVVETRDLTDLEWEVTLPGVSGTLPSRLDLAFVVDATGSMGDELEYLKAEVRDIAAAVNELFPLVTQRYALIVYRDVGDIYVTRTFDFTTSLDEFQADLDDQNASGGGDWPEAMDRALEEALELSWQASDTARVLFLIADAPPHVEHAEDAFDAIQALRAATVAVYPVAASGVDTELEFYLRTAAFLTLSEYLFLTDDSGVGNPHAEPHIPCYHVQRLDQLMIRMIEAELSGTRVEPDPEDIIRTVGNPVNGVCAEVEDEQDGQTQ